jgi:alkylhydroperoxidase family enzyme
MPRIPYVDIDSLHPAVQEAYQALPVKLNLFRMLAHAERNFRPLTRLGGTILARQMLAAKLREHAILLVAQLSRARYEWVQHVPIAIDAGATREQVDAIEREDLTAECFDHQERAVLAFTEEVVRQVRPSDGALAALSRWLSHREVVELTLAIGYYMMMARLMETTGVDLDEPAGGRLLEGAGPGKSAPRRG